MPHYCDHPRETRRSEKHAEHGTNASVSRSHGAVSTSCGTISQLHTLSGLYMGMMTVRIDRAGKAYLCNLGPNKIHSSGMKLLTGVVTLLTSLGGKHLGFLPRYYSRCL